MSKVKRVDRKFGRVGSGTICLQLHTADVLHFLLLCCQFIIENMSKDILFIWDKITWLVVEAGWLLCSLLGETRVIIQFISLYTLTCIEHFAIRGPGTASTPNFNLPSNTSSLHNNILVSVCSGSRYIYSIIHSV